ncbi:MAG: hypothetical protein Kow006_18740 [Gammaproteobacteria bacterium]
MRNVTGSAWNPGLESELPRQYRHLETLFRPENSDTGVAEADELAELTGLAPEELVRLRPGRLMLHELMVRVTADIVVPEGESEEDLGIRFRAIADRILSGYLQPRLAEIERCHAELREQVRERVEAIFSESLFPEERERPARRRFSVRTLWGFWRRTPERHESPRDRELQIVAGFRERGLAAEEPLERAIFKGLYRVLGSILARRGYLLSDRELMVRLVTDFVSNSHGSRRIGELIDPVVREAVAKEGYRWIPDAEKPVLFSLKGASAAGKSYLRPMLRKVIRDLGIGPDGYGTISPDIWRRLLLDYESLGEAYKYAGRLTSHEVLIIDGKLDRYIRDKAERRGSIPHLVVDRFRFDSFTSEKVARILHGTYVKYVDTMYMYFIVTPPEATVERGWQRGLERGRFKAVEDFLDHSVEAYTGMPKIFFKWLAYERPLYRYEFLDNSVPKGTYPRSIAYGTQQEMTLFNPLGLVDIERYQKININARSPEAVYPDGPALAVENNLGFLKQCLKRIPKVRFIDPVTGQVYLRARGGTLETVDEEILAALARDESLARLFAALGLRLVAPV